MKPLDVALTYGPFVHGRGDPSSRITGNEWWRAMNTTDGPATLRVQLDDGEPRVDAWGPGRSWVLDRAPDIVGDDDNPDDFEPANALVAELHRRNRGFRIVRLRAAFDLAVSTIIEQRVTSLEAHRSWRALVRRHGTPAPGGHPLIVPPSPATLARLPDWEWRRIGVELRRSSTVRRLAIEASRVEGAADQSADLLARRLLGINGIGPWTAATVTHLAAADTDAVPVGDWHLPGHIGYALAGEPRADDARMLELLEPLRPHRARAWRLLVAGTPAPPRRVPRQRIIGLLHAERQRGYF